jgi:hypothetical protein
MSQALWAAETLNNFPHTHQQPSLFLQHLCQRCQCIPVCPAALVVGPNRSSTKPAKALMRTSSMSAASACLCALLTHRKPALIPPNNKYKPPQHSDMHQQPRSLFLQHLHQRRQSLPVCSAVTPAAQTPTPMHTAPPCVLTHTLEQHMNNICNAQPLQTDC